MFFDFTFYGLFTLSTLIAYKVIRSKRSKNWFIKGIKTIPVLVCLSFWGWLGVLFFMPKGTLLHEAVRIPRDFWMLEHARIKEGTGRERFVYGKHPRQYYDYYPAPKSSSHPEKVVFFIHGGAWTAGSPQQHRYLSYLLQQEGYSSIFPAYRLTPLFAYNDLQEDINAALISSLEMLQKKGIQHIQIVLGGASAGGNLALLLAYNKERWQTLNLNRTQLLKGAFSIVGAIDIEEMAQTTTLHEYTGPKHEKEYALANPKNWVSADDDFPFLCMHGTKDGLVDYRAAVSFCNEVKLYCPECVNFQTYKNATHLEVGSSWYYNKKDRLGQDTALINWLKRVYQAPPPIFYKE